MAFSPAGGLLATANLSADSVSVFAVGSGGALTQVTGSPFATGSGPASVAFSPGGGLLATANDSAPHGVGVRGRSPAPPSASIGAPIDGQIYAVHLLVCGCCGRTGDLVVRGFERVGFAGRARHLDGGGAHLHGDGDQPGRADRDRGDLLYGRGGAVGATPRRVGMALVLGDGLSRDQVVHRFGRVKLAGGS